MSTQELANIYSSINNVQLGLNEVTGNTFSNYNQLSRIVSQQANIYNTLYYGTGNMSTGFLSVSENCNISGNLVVNSNMGINTTTPFANLHIAGNAIITGNVNVNNGNIFMSRFGNLGIGTTSPTTPLQVVGDGNISGNVYSSTGYIPLCRASISFKYVSPTLTTIYSNNCSVSRNGTGSYTITLTNPPNSTNYTVIGNACGGPTLPATITATFTGTPGMVILPALKSSIQCLIWITDNNNDTAFDPFNMCDLHFFW